MDVGGQRRGPVGRHATGQESPDDAGEHVARSGGGERRDTGRRRAARRRRPRRVPGAATAVSGPLEQDDGPQLRPARSRAAASRSLAGRRSGQPGVLAVVGREDGRVVRLPARSRRAAREVTEGGDGVGVDHQGERGAGDDGPDLLLRAASRPRPGPTTRAWHFTVASRNGDGPPRRRPGSPGPPRSGQGPAGSPGDAQTDHPRAGRQSPPGAQARRSPPCPPTRPRRRARCSTCSTGAAGAASHAGDVGVLDQGGGGRRRGECRCPPPRPPRQRPDRHLGGARACRRRRSPCGWPRTAAPGAAPVSASTPEGMSMDEHRRAPAATAGAS